MTERVDEDVRGVAAPFLCHHVHVGLGSAERDHASAKPVDVTVEQRLGRRDHGGTSMQLLDELGLGGGDVGDRADKLQVDGSDIRDHAHVRQGDARELADLPVTAHRHLHDDDLGALVHLQEGEGNADLVVEIGPRGHGARQRLKQRGQNVLGRGLAGAAGDGDDLHAGAPADVRGESLQRREPVVDDDPRGAGGQAGRGLGADHDRGRSGRQGLRRVGVAVELVAAQADEELAAGQAARIGAHRGRRRLRVAALETAAAGLGDLGERQRQHDLTPPRAARREAPRPPCGRRTARGGRR